MKLQQADIAVLFNSVKQMYTLNSTFLHDLEQRLTDGEECAGNPESAIAWSASADMGRSRARPRGSLSAVVSSADDAADLDWQGDGPGVVPVGDLLEGFAPLCKMYAQYAVSHQAVQQLLGDPGLRSFVDDLAADPRANGQSVDSFLIKPIQRVPRYKLLFQELLKRTPDGHQDKRALQAAVVAVDTAAKHINQVRHGSVCVCVCVCVCVRAQRLSGVAAHVRARVEQGIHSREGSEKLQAVMRNIVDWPSVERGLLDGVSDHRQFIREGTLARVMPSSVSVRVVWTGTTCRHRHSVPSHSAPSHRCRPATCTCGCLATVCCMAPPPVNLASLSFTGCCGYAVGSCFRLAFRYVGVCGVCCRVSGVCNLSP